MHSTLRRTRAPRARIRHHTPVVVAAALALTVTACGGGGAKSLGSPDPTSPPGASASTTTTAIPRSSTPRLAVSATSWTLASAVSRQALATDGTSLFVAGGLDGRNVSTDAVVKIDPANGTQTRLATLDLAVHDTSGVILGDAFLVIAGGTPPTRAAVQSVARNGTVRTIAQIPQVRADHVAAVVNDTVYVLGGGDENASLVIPVVSSTDGATWREAGTLAEGVRYPAVAVSGRAVYLFGGVATAGGIDTRSVQRYDPATGKTTVVAQLPAPQSHASAVVLGGAIYVIGGFVDNKLSTQILRFDPTTNQLTAAGNLPTVVSDAAAATVGATAYLVGGEGAERRALTSVYALRLT